MSKSNNHKPEQVKASLNRLKQVLITIIVIINVKYTKPELAYGVGRRCS